MQERLVNGRAAALNGARANVSAAGHALRPGSPVGYPVRDVSADVSGYPREIPEMGRSTRS
jgi:hypothetical protein